MMTLNSQFQSPSSLSSTSSHGCKRRRKRSFKAIICLSLVTTATGFSSTSRNSFPTLNSHAQEQTTSAYTRTTLLFTNRSTGKNKNTNNNVLFMKGQADKYDDDAFVGGGRGRGRASSSSSSTTTSTVRSLPRLTREEEQELLQKVAESRRLRQLMVSTTTASTTTTTTTTVAATAATAALADSTTAPSSSSSFISVRAEAAGYGTDWEAYETALMDGADAREELVTRNMGLVYYCVNQIWQQKKHSLNSLSKEDLIQEGAIGLARAVDKYNLNIGGKLSTYAVYWIRAAILRGIAERDDLLRVPSHVTQAIIQVNKAAQRLGIDMGGGSSTGGGGAWQEAKEAKRLAEEAGLSERNFEEAMKVRNRRYTGGYVAFESWMQKGENLSSDVPSSMTTSSSSTSTSHTASSEREHLRQTLAKFVRPKEMEALSYRYGLVEDMDSDTADADADADADVETTSPQQRAQQYLVDAEEHIFGTTGSSATMATASATAKKAQSRTLSTVKRAASRKSIPTKGRFGEAMSFNEVGKKMKVSAEYGRRLCHAGLSKLQQAAEDGRLEPALLL